MSRLAISLSVEDSHRNSVSRILSPTSGHPMVVIMNRVCCCTLALSISSGQVFAADPDPNKLPNVKKVLEGAQDEVRANLKAYQEANKKVLEETKKKLLAEVTRLKEADQLEEAVAVKRLAEDLNAVRRLVEVTPVGGGGPDAGGLPQGELEGKGWVPLQPNIGVESLMIYPALAGDKGLLKQHLEGKLQKSKGGRIAPRDQQGLYLVPNDTGAAFSALCAVRTNSSTRMTIKASGNTGYGQTNVKVAVNNLQVASGQQVVLPKGDSLVHVLIEVRKTATQPDETWFRLDLEAEPGKVEVFVP